MLASVGGGEPVNLVLLGLTSRMPALTIRERFSYAAIGALLGAGYGAIIAVIVAWHSDGLWNSAYLKSGAVVFAVLSFLAGPFLGDLVASVLHFVLALGSVEVAYSSASRLGLVWPLVLLGLGTFVAVLLVGYVW